LTNCDYWIDPTRFDLVVLSGIIETVGIILGESPDPTLKVSFLPFYFVD
jgi:hypothetical protein